MTKKELIEFLAPYPDNMNLWRRGPINEPITMEEVVWWYEEEVTGKIKGYTIPRDCSRYEQIDKSCVKAIMLK